MSFDVMTLALAKSYTDQHGDSGGGGASTADKVGYINAALPYVSTVGGALDELIPKSHTHANKDTLDKLSVSNGKLQYNGSDVGLKGDNGSDATVTAANIAGALGYTPAAPSDIPVVPAAEISANTAARHSHANKGVIDGITGQVTADKVNAPDHTTDLVQYGAFQIAVQQIIEKIPTVPTALKNPNALTVKIGSTTVTYDGSSAQTVEIADGTEVEY